MLLLKSLLGKHFLVVVSETSMNPTLAHGDVLLVRHLQKPLARGNLVIADIPLQNPNIQVKRVVGLPRDRVVFEDSSLFINDEFYPENYLGGLPQTVGLSRAEWRLGLNEYFLLGDNRSRSVDSREYGPVPAESILAQALLRVWPLNNGMRAL